MLNEFTEKVVVHEGEGRGNDRRQRIDIYLNFIGAFEVPEYIVTPAEVVEQRRQREDQAAKEARSKEQQRRVMRNARQRNGHLPQGKRRGFSPRWNWKRWKSGLHITGSGKRNGGRNEKPASRRSRPSRNP